MIRNLIRKRLTVLTMSFDSYMRYKLVSEILAKEDCNTILDVGGGGGKFFRRFLPHKESLTLDKEDGDIIGDGTNLPFPKNHFDAVTSLETLQYVEKKKRKKFISELIRVAKNCVVITLPLDGRELQSAERRCNGMYRSMFGKGNRWLDQHAKNGLPSMKEMGKILSGREVKMHQICNLSRWEKLVKINFILQKIHLSVLSSVINAIYIALYGMDMKEPTYTKIFFVKGVN